MREIGRLPLAPRWLGVGVRVCAAGHDGGYTLAEAGTDVGQSRRPARVLGGVVEQGGDRLVLAAAVLENQGRDP
jgi:hypothetical protein